MSFLDRIKKKKKALKSCETTVSTLSGEKFLESRNRKGDFNSQKLSETCFGFVADYKPDLEIAEILPFLYLSSQDPVQDGALLESNSITSVLSIGVEIPRQVQSPRIEYKHVNLLDVPESNLLRVFNECFEFIDNERLKNECKILVHCSAGYSRSPSVVIGYLMKTFKYSFSKAFDLVKEKRNVKPNEGFVGQLKNYESYLNSVS